MPAPLACPVCGVAHGAPPFRLASARPDRLADLAPSTPGLVIGDDNAALADAAWFVRGDLVLPLAGAPEPAMIYAAWCAVDRASYKRALALARSPRRATDPPIAATLASALPGHAGALGAAVLLHGRPPGERLAIVVAPPHPLSAAQRIGVEPAGAAALFAAALHGCD